MLKTNWLFRVKILPLILSLALLSVFSVNAFAISSAYGSETPIEIQPGETRDIQFKLMTALGEGNLIIKAELIDDGGIASLTDSDLEYKVNAGEIVPVNLRISVDKSAKIGEEYNIIIKFLDITPYEKEGSVSFKGSSTISLKVSVVSVGQVGQVEQPPELKETKEGIGLFFIFGFFLLVLIIAIILVIWLVVRNRKK